MVGNADTVARCDREYRSGKTTMVFTDMRGQGPETFVMLHGIGMGRIVFEAVDEILSSAGRVLAVDLPGFGDSPEPGSEATIEETAEVIATFIRDEASGPVVLVGHSMGTQIAAEVAHRYPEFVRALVLIAPTVNRHERTVPKQAMRLLQDLAGEEPKVLLLGFWEYLKTSPIWFLRKLRFMLAHRLETITANIATPTLVLHGETDRVCPRGWAGEIADSLPDSEIAEIQGRGHEAIIKSPEPVASMILDFLRLRKLLRS